MLLLTAGVDLGYLIFVVAKEKFISVTAFSKSDDPVHHVGNSACRLENCHATASVILCC